VGGIFSSFNLHVIDFSLIDFTESGAFFPAQDPATFKPIGKWYAWILHVRGLSKDTPGCIDASFVLLVAVKS